MKKLSNKITKKKVIVLVKIVLSILLVLSILYSFNKIAEKILKDIETKNLNNKSWVSDNVSIKTDSSFGTDIKSVEKSDSINIYNMLYQNVVSEKISNLNKTDYTLDNALIIYNPYGTNKLSFNIYFKTDILSSVSYKISVDDSSTPDFIKTLNNEEENNLTKNHEYQLTGFVPGYKNHLTITVKDQNGNSINERTLDIDMSNIKTTSTVKLKNTKGKSTEELTDGLYTILGLDKNFSANTYLYDNNGIIRAELVLNNYRSDRVIFIDSDMIYSYSKTGFARVNRLGQVIKEYSTKNYYMHHDYVYDEENNSLVVLVNESKTSTIEDKVISINLDTKKVTKIIDTKKLLTEKYEQATIPKKNTYGGTELDWIHINSLQIINSKDIVLSSRELSTIIYVKDAYTNPTIKYLISDESMYENSTYKNLLLTKIGSFTSNAGQHTITYSKTAGLEENQYYLEMFNNNYGGARTIPSFDWSNYDGVGSFETGEKSMYYKYLVDEDKKTYTLVEKVDLPYSSIVSSIQKIDGNLMTSSGKNHTFSEFDSNNILISEFKYNAKKYAYRVFKYKYENWFKE